MSKKAYPNATQLLITADGGHIAMAIESKTLEAGTPAARRPDRLLTISVSPLRPARPSGTRSSTEALFCHITENWRGRPLIDLETITCS